MYLILHYFLRRAPHFSAIFAEIFLTTTKDFWVIPVFKNLIAGPVAQWIEQQPSKLWVERSSRSGVTLLLPICQLVNLPYFACQIAGNECSNGRKLEACFKG